MCYQCALQARPNYAMAFGECIYNVNFHFIPVLACSVCNAWFFSIRFSVFGLATTRLSLIDSFIWVASMRLFPFSDSRNFVVREYVFL